MFVRALLLHRYGSFTDRLVDFGPGSLSLVIGPNEAGKSTSLDALSDLLWGIPNQSAQAFLYGRPALSLEATLELPGEGKVQVCRRSTGLTRVDTGTVVPPAWQAAGDSRSRWRESFGLSHAQLREGGRLLCEGGGDLADLVFTARSGRAVRELLDQVQSTADLLYKEHRGNKTVLVRQALADYEEARARAAEATAAASQVAGAREAAVLAAAESGRTERWVQEARAALAEAEQRQNAAPNARQLADVRARIATVRGEGAALGKEQLTAFERLQATLTSAEAALAALGEQLAGLEADRVRLVVDEGILADAGEIRRLHLEAEARSVDGQQAERLSGKAAGLEGQVGVLVAELVGEVGDQPIPVVLASLHVPVDSAAQLDAVAEELRKAEERFAVREEALQEATRRLAEADVRGLGLDTHIVAAVREVFDAVEAEGSAVSAQRAAVDARAEALRRRAESLRLAGLPTGAAVPAIVPSVAAIREAAELLTAADNAVADAERRITRAQAAAEDIRVQLEGVAETELPRPQDVTLARERRDATITELVTACQGGDQPDDLPDRVRANVSAADAVADLLLAHADAAARQTELAKALDEKEAEHAEAVEELTAYRESRAEADARWTGLWPGFESATPSLADAAEVRRYLEDARAAEEDFAAADDRITGLQPRVDAQVTALSAVLVRAERPRPDADLDGLLAAARALLGEADEAAGQRAARDELARLEQEQRRARNEAAAARDATVERWRAQLVAVGVPADLDVAAWRRRRDLVAEARGYQRQADELRHQAAEAQARTQAFLHAISTLANRHGIAADDPAGVVASLSARREAALADRRTIDDLDRRIAALQTPLADAQARHAEALRGLDSQRTAIRLADGHELAAAAARGRQLLDLDREEVRLTDLTRAAAPDLELEALVTQDAASEPDVLAAACAEARANLAKAEEELRTALGQEAAAKQRERDLTTGAGAAELHARAQEHLAVVGERVERYLVARIQGEVLRRELGVYERKHASPLLDEAGEILQRLTGGRHVALGVSNRNGGRGLVVIGADEERRAPNQLSEGTADQVFLALRLAGIASLQRERLAGGLPSLPVVLDDVLMTFDDGRAQAALRVMADLSKQWQVIVFSHHAHLASLAESLALPDLTVAQLAPPVEVVAQCTAEEVRIRARTASVEMSPAASASTWRPSVPRPSRTTLSMNTPQGAQPGAVREWARSVGYEIGERGRIPADVIAAYEQAHRN